MIIFIKHNNSVTRYSHTAWTPSSLPDSIVLLGGDSSATKFTAEIVPGKNRHYVGFILFITRWINIHTGTQWVSSMWNTRWRHYSNDWRLQSLPQLCDKVGGAKSPPLSSSTSGCIIIVIILIFCIQHNHQIIIICIK